MGNVGMEMMVMVAPTLELVIVHPRIPPPPQARREPGKTIKRRNRSVVSYNDGLAS
jgi:hypothetical protein